MNTKVIVIAFILAVVGLGGYWVFNNKSEPTLQDAGVSSEIKVTFDFSTLTTKSKKPTITGKAEGLTTLSSVAVYPNVGPMSARSEQCYAYDVPVVQGHWSATLTNCNAESAPNGLWPSTYDVVVTHQNVEIGRAVLTVTE